MSVTVQPKLIKEIKKYGAFDISACFNCGNCTAVCPISDEHGSFPRKLIRLGQIGSRDRILASPEPWLCYYCGECSDTCPRQAEPGEYMAALRRYTIAASEPTGIARLMYRNGIMAILITLLVGIVFGAFMLSVKMGENPAHWLFSPISYEFIHVFGIIVSIVTLLTLVGGVANVWRRIMNGADMPKTKSPQWLAAIIKTVAEVATMARHRQTTEESVPGPWYKQSAWIHMGIMYGFFGLIVATSLDFIFLVLLPLHLTVFWPSRIIGTVAGLAMLWGVSAAIWRRMNKTEKNVEHSRLPDWWVLIFLFVLGVTGFWLELAVTFRAAGAINDAVMLIHAAMAMELVLLMAFTKMAHVIYRPIALFAYYLKKSTEEPA